MNHEAASDAGRRALTGSGRLPVKAIVVLAFNRREQREGCRFNDCQQFPRDAGTVDVRAQPLLG